MCCVLKILRLDSRPVFVRIAGVIAVLSTQYAFADSPPLDNQFNNLINQHSGVKLIERQSCNKDMDLQKISTKQSSVIPALKSVAANEVKACIRASSRSADKIDMGNTLLVDIRSASEYAQYHSPDSLNIPPRELAHKASWSDKSIGLINDGFDDGQTIHNCAELRTRGFADVFIIPGGLQRSHNTYEPLAVNLKGMGSLYGMPASALFQNQRYSDWILISVTQESVSDSLRAAFDRQSIQWVDMPKRDLDGWVKSATNVEQVHAGASRIKNKVVLLGDEDVAMAKAVQQLRKQYQAEVYFITGGMKALEWYQQKQTAMLNYEPKPRRLHSCGNTG